MNLITDIVGVAVGALLLILAFYGIVILGGIALYVLQALGLYTLAQRRGIRKSWFAWIPVLSLWTLGSLSDQYRYVVRHQFRSRRKWLLILSLVGCVLGVASSALYTGGVVSLMMGLPMVQDMQDMLYLLQTQPVLMAAAGISCVVFGLNMVGMFLRWVCLHDVYASCVPEKKVLYTLLSILLPVVIPVLLFLCREKDVGMPPRRMQNA